MELFNKFRDTIFVKDDSNLTKQIDELKELKEINHNPNIDKDVMLLEKGLFGEKQIEFELKNAGIGMYVLHDITIKYEDLKAQIDYIIITKGYTYLIECKNLIGNITINNKGEFTREYAYNNRLIKEGIYSPYTQCLRHLEILKKRWIKNNNKLIVALEEKDFTTLWYKPLVVLANSKLILKDYYAPKEIKEHAIRVDQLIDYIKKDLANYDHSLFLSKKVMAANADKFLKANDYTYTSLANKYENRDNNLSLKEQLINYRSDKAKKLNIPSYYIFTNEELNKILVKKPRKIDDLKQILPNIKIKYHGQEIINIIEKNNL
jgi:superfamily II DNA helicase RecQ